MSEPWKELKSILAPNLAVWALALWCCSRSASSWQYLNMAGTINLLKKSFMTQINDYKKCQQCPCKRLILVYKFQALCHKKNTRNNRADDAIGGETYQFEMLQTVHCRILCKGPAGSVTEFERKKRIYIHCP